MDRFRAYYRQHPLRFALLAGLFFRLIATVFSEGFIASDDHFLVVEPAQGWYQGIDLDIWFADSVEQDQTGRSLFYPGMHYLVFGALDSIGISDPAAKMLFVRLLHALLSLLVIYYAFLITYRLSDLKTASKVGLMMAVFWMFPALVVRNLVELVAVPALLSATWCALSAPSRKSPFLWYMYAGALLELSFVIRYQVGLYTMGFFFGILILRQWRSILPLAIGYGIPFLLLHGVLETYTGGAPFSKIFIYIQYNILHATSYFDDPAWKYVLFICGVLIPPVGLFLFSGTFWSARRYWPMFLGTIVFFGFHSAFPNKQERFMFTMIPFFIILGTIGWGMIERDFPFWKTKARKFVRFSWGWFWTLNMITVCLASWQSRKLMLVDSMRFIGAQNDVVAVVTEDMHDGRGRGPQMPRFYMGTYHDIYRVGPKTPYDSLRARIDRYDLQPEEMPNYVMFVRHWFENIDDRVDSMEAILGPMDSVTTIKPALADRLYLIMNPFIASSATDDMTIFRVRD